MFSVAAGRVFGQGPFVEVGDPTAVHSAGDVVAVGGDLGPVQWDARSCYDRSDRSVGWFPVGIYRADDLSCLAVFTSRWRVNSIAVHPSGRFVAVGTGSYDGGHFYEGELLVYDVEQGTTTSLLDELRQVEKVSWAEDGSVDRELAPATDEDGVVPARDDREHRRTLRQLAAAHGLTWELRRRAWAVAGVPGGVVLGLESGIECWRDEPSPAWRIDLDGTCTQLLPSPDGSLVALASTALRIDPATGEHREAEDPGHPAVLVGRSDGELLLRDTRHASGYDLFNHYFDVRRAKDFLMLVGDEPRPHRDKWVASVRREVQRLFPLAWEPGVHVFGGPGVYVEDEAGPGLIHAGEVYDGKGLLAGNAFVVRRSYPDGRLVWKVSLDNQVTALDEADGRVVAVTNLGELVVVETVTGRVTSEASVEVGGHRVVPLSLCLNGADRAWIGTLDGRAVEVLLL